MSSQYLYISAAWLVIGVLTRNNGDYNQTKNKKVFTYRAVRTTGAILWNVLNDHLKNVNSIKQFREKKNQKMIYLNLLIVCLLGGTVIKIVLWYLNYALYVTFYVNSDHFPP